MDSLEAQQQFYTSMIDMRSDWINAGIFSDHATGLNTAERPGLNAMLRLCRSGKIDLILTKSFSRFGRNTLDMLKTIRELRRLNVDVYFERENVWLHQQESSLLITAYCALSQAESESMSQNIKWGIRCGFQNGTSGYADFVCFGYKRGDDGELAVDEPDAAVVRKIFWMKVNGSSLREISDWLYRHQILSPTGKDRWSPETIRKLLRNEKYTGDVRLQKTISDDLFSKKRSKNMGQLEKYLVWEHHPAIISRELFRRASPEVYEDVYQSPASSEEYVDKGDINMLFVEYPKCTTCQKARKWLESHGAAFTTRHIKDEAPTAEELKEWWARSGLPLKKFFNTSGLKYKELALKDKLPGMSETEQLALLVSDGMLVKWPILVGNDFVLVGFRESEWAAALGIRTDA